MHGDRVGAVAAGTEHANALISPPSAAFFDLDKTVIARSSTLAFSRSFYRAGLMNRRNLVRGAFTQLSYVVGSANSDQVERMRAYLTRLVAGWDVALVSSLVADTLHELIDPLVYAEAATLIAEHSRAGRDVVVVSASGTEVVGPIGELLGVDEVVATQMVVEDGRYTGEIATYVYGQAKADAVLALALARGYDLAASFAYSDSVTDLPMLEAVGHPHVVNPDRSLRREAESRGWPVLVFTRPVRLRSRTHGIRAIAMVVSAAGVTALTLTLALARWAARRGRTGSGCAGRRPGRTPWGQLRPRPTG